MIFRECARNDLKRCNGWIFFKCHKNKTLLMMILSLEQLVMHNEQMKQEFKCISRTSQKRIAQTKLTLMERGV